MGTSDVKCPMCGNYTSQSPCSYCGYEFPDYEKEDYPSCYGDYIGTYHCLMKCEHGRFCQIESESNKRLDRVC